jgi:Lon protease-like protein
VAADPGAEEIIPLFPLGSVLYPGLLLPLHIFEDRYRQLLSDLQELPQGRRRFGVVAIRRGRDVGVDGVQALHDVGCAAHVRRVETAEDGRSNVVTTGGRRFRIDRLIHDSAPYLQASVTWLEEGSQEAAEPLREELQARFNDYLTALGAAKGVELTAPAPAGDPSVLSYLVAATVVADLQDKQALLACEDTVARMRAELSLLRRETALITHLPSVPAAELTSLPTCLN